MPSEPDNKMDDLLKAYAKKRRDEAGAPIEMHPATRRLLQTEAAKLRPAAAPAPASWLLALKAFWPRVAFAAGVLIVVGIAAITFLPPADQKENSMQLAKQDAASPVADGYVTDERKIESRRVLAPSPAKPESEKEVSLQDRISSLVRRESKALPELAAASEADSAEVAKKLKAVDLAKNEPLNNVAMNPPPGSPAANAPVVAPPASEPVRLGAVVAQSDDKTGRGAGGPPAPAPTTFAASTGSGAIADVKQVDALALSLKEQKPAVRLLEENEALTGFKSEAPVRQQLNNAAARSRFANVQQAVRPTPGEVSTGYGNTVLANFIVEQDGEQLRVVDGDGSVYSGKLLYGEPAEIKDAEAQKSGDDLARRDESKRAPGFAGKDVQRLQAQAAPFGDAPAASAWGFRVSGTNRTLKQPVTVDAVLYESAITNSLNQPGNATAAESQQFYRVAPGQAPARQRGYNYSLTTVPAQNASASALNNSQGVQSLNLQNARRIQGSVRVGATNQLPLDAVPDGNPR